MQTSFLYVLPKHFVWVLNCGKAFILSRQFQYLNAHFLKFVRNKSEAYSILWWIRRLNMHKPIFLSLINPQQSFAIFFLWRPFLGKFNQNKYFYDEGPRIFESKVNFSRFSKKQILIYEYRISSYSFRRNYSFLNLEIAANSNSCHNISIFYLINWFFAAL